MILWSIVSAEDVYEGYGDPQHVKPLATITHQGVTMLVEPLGPGSAKIHRLISPHAADYLKAEWQPGNVIATEIPQTSIGSS
ncbi:YlzJ-like family protein [Ferroacidibacillus organovorans]|uniref:Uncharacterized protein n=1 Tax=Ferroacidibacillus organovorans TaxID=1765683 RepID=A0A162UWE1_9BACL|nr:YlzJ-like family protein [Ferroacidibacillus organovorans]KYP82085.1 hypothetical protein AYJ22_00020 [Ferroacidibacillus organovorans]OAG91285.1 hypothetical protein AYW79_13835 [Ferroacidibacillus organovorans]OPG15629.1 hypothetical protein B2M26_11260 [Ferroacidibacillus organovorans]